MGTPELPERLYKLEEACEEGVIGMGVEQAKKARTRTRKDHPGFFPESRTPGRPEKYTADDLREWEYWYNKERKAQ